MTQTGWIVMAVIAVIAILLAIIFITRRRPSNALPIEPVAPAETLLPEQVDLARSTPPTEPVTLTEQTARPYPVAEPQPTLADDGEAPVPIDLSGALAENEHPADTSSPASTPAPVKQSPEPVSVSTPSAPPAPSPAPDGDNLLRLKGVGPKIATLLKSEGITRYAQIAAWTDADIAAIDAKLGSFAGRPRRDNWVDQARLLAAGDVAGYEGKYGKL